MSRQIPYTEYKRRVFNVALLEALRKPYFEALGITESFSSEPAADTVQESAAQSAMRRLSEASGKAKTDAESAEAAPTEVDGSEKKATKNEKPLNSCSSSDAAICETMCNTYFITELGLNESTISKTKEKLAGANHYVVEAAEEAEVIATNKADDAAKDGVAIHDDDKIDLSPEDHAVLDQLFHSKGPGPQIDQIRDATVKALMSEEQKSKEVRDALDLAKSKVSTGDLNAYQETANRISQVGPTSLMGAIMNSMSRAAIHDVNENGTFTSIGDVLAENADEIKTRSVMLYAIMETGNQLEITHFTARDVERLANDIFYQK